MLLKVLFPLKDIPDGSTVIKKTGNMQYIVNSEFVIYHQSGHKQIIKADHGCKFLMSTSKSNISAVDGSTEVLWVVDHEPLYRTFNDEDSDD